MANSKSVVVIDGCASIPLLGSDGSPRAWALVDEEDLSRLSAVGRWSLHSQGYATYRGDVLLHYAVLGLAQSGRRDGQKVVPINGDRLDCRKSNLRIVARRPRVRLPRGVSQHSGTGRWRARVVRDGRERVACFDTPEAAAAAVVEMRG